MSASLPVPHDQPERRVSESARPLVGPRLTYRADVDGLRAIAVLAVVAYHAGVEAVGGGPLQFDDGHLTAKGSVSLARLLVREGLLN